MSDALTTEGDLERTSEQGQSERANDEAQAKAEKQESSKKVNLHELPEYREVQSKMDRERAQLQNALQREQQARVDMQRRLESIEERTAPDDFTRLELRLQRKDQELNAIRGQLQEQYDRQQAQEARENVLNGIATKHKVPRSELESATNYEEAMDMAIAYLTDAKAQKAKEQEERRERNMPDVGGGKPATPMTRLERELEDARERRDSVAMVRLKRQLAAQK